MESQELLTNQLRRLLIIIKYNLAPDSLDNIKNSMKSYSKLLQVKKLNAIIRLTPRTINCIRCGKIENFNTAELVYLKCGHLFCNINCISTYFYDLNAAFEVIKNFRCPAINCRISTDFSQIKELIFIHRGIIIKRKYYLRTCSICRNSVYSEESIQINCYHYYCLPCFRANIDVTFKTSGNKIPICMCGVQINKYYYKALLPN